MAQGYQTGISPADFNAVVESVKKYRQEIKGATGDVKAFNQAQGRGNGSSTTLGGRSVSQISGGSDFIGPKPATASQIARQLKSEEATERRTREQFFRMWDRRSNEISRPKTQAEKERETFLTSRILPDGALSPIVGKALASGLGGVGKSGGGAGTFLASAAGGALAKDGMGIAARGISSVLGYAPGSVAAGETAFLVAAAAAAALPIIIAGAAGIGAIAAIYETAGTFQARNAQFYKGGGSQTDIGQALSLGGPNGGDKALQFGSFLRGGGYGAAYFRSKGITDLGDYFTTNKSRNYVSALDALRKIRDPEEKIRIARGSPLEEDLWKTDLSPDAYNALKNSIGGNSQGANRTSNELAAKKETFLNHLGNSWNLATIGLGSIFNDITSGDARRTVKGFWNASGPGLLLNAGDYLYKLFTGQDVSFNDGEGPENKTGQAKGFNGKRYVNRTLKDGPDWVNADRRARGAVPPGMIGQAVDTQFNFDNINLGGISAAPQ